MLRSRLVESGLYEAESKSGTRYTIVAETRQLGFDTNESTSTSWRNGPIYYRTLDHKPVFWVSNQEFTIVHTGEIVTRL